MPLATSKLSFCWYPNGGRIFYRLTVTRVLKNFMNSSQVDSAFFLSKWVIEIMRWETLWTCDYLDAVHAFYQLYLLLKSPQLVAFESGLVQASGLILLDILCCSSSLLLFLRKSVHVSTWKLIFFASMDSVHESQFKTSNFTHISANIFILFYSNPNLWMLNRSEILS